MKIRITGTREEVEGITELLKEKPYIRSISSPYKNRGISNDYRIYIETYDLQKDFFIAVNEELKLNTTERELIE